MQPRFSPPFLLYSLSSVLMLAGFGLCAQGKSEGVKLKSAIQQAPTQAQAEVDSLQSLLKTILKKTDRIEIYGRLCFAHASTLGNVNAARQYADSIQLLAHQLKDAAGLASANYYYGLVARYEGKNPEALAYLSKQLDYCKASGDSSQLANTLFQMSIVHQDMGNYEKSLSLSYQIIQIYEKEHYSYGLGITFMSIGNLSVHLKKYPDAIAMYTKALAALNGAEVNLDVKMNKLRVMMNIGNTYLGMKEYEKSRSYYQQSLLISDSLGSRRTRGTCLSSLGEILNAEGKYGSALVYHLKALAIREQAAQSDKILLSLLRVGETYLYLKNYPVAKIHLLRALALATSLQAKPGMRDAYERLSALCSSQQNFARAYAYHQLYAAMKDSVLNEQTSRQLQELQTKYETGEKDKQIILLAKEKEIQQKEVQRQATLKKAFLAGLGLVTVIALLMIYGQRQRMKNQKILTVKNQQIQESELKRQVSELKMKALRAQMNPHFIFNCMNSINRLVLEGQADDASRYLTKFAKLMRLMLENAEKATVSLQSELTMLESYIQLENLRFKGRISYQITVGEQIDQQNTYLPSMVLQPFVENAIWHGLMHKQNDEPGLIRIGIEESQDLLKCVIEDNGVGRQKAVILKEKSLVSNKSMGLQITDERLKLLSKQKLQELVHITDLKDSLDRALGTRVDILIPLA